MPEMREPPKTPEHAERLICLVEAYDDNVFRNSVALAVWSLFRVLCPKLRPWHAVDHTQRYPGDDLAQREARESDLATLTNCAVFGVRKKFFRWTISCAQDPEMTHTSINLLGTWAIALACGMLCKEQWLALIHSDKKEVVHDLEISHLCGLSSCVSSWPFVPESHAANLARKSCHQADRCHCPRTLAARSVQIAPSSPTLKPHGKRRYARRTAGCSNALSVTLPSSEWPTSRSESWGRRLRTITRRIWMDETRRGS
jgi:hypothetical protein